MSKEQYMDFINNTENVNFENTNTIINKYESSIEHYKNFKEYLAAEDENLASKNLREAGIDIYQCCEWALKNYLKKRYQEEFERNEISIYVANQLKRELNGAKFHYLINKFEKYSEPLYSELEIKTRVILDNAGYKDCKICGTNSLDEYVITSIIDEGAKLDSFGVGENLITAKSNPVFGGVYKLSAIEKEGRIIPKIKVSNNTIKITNPGFKKTYRFYDKKTNKALADVIALHDEIIPEDNYTIFDQTATWKKKTLTNYTIRPLQEKIFDNGILVYTSPALKEIAENAKAELNTLWNEVKRMKNPHKYYVDLSQELWNLKDSMLHNL